MFVTRILDLTVLALVAAALLMPRPDVKVKPALRLCDARVAAPCLTPAQRERVAELQARRMDAPGSADAAFELGNLFLDGKRPDWALAAASAALAAHAGDWRLHMLRTLAYLDRFEPEPAFEAVKRAVFECDNPGAGAPACGAGARSRLALLESTVRRLQGVDMRKQPYLAKERNFESLHPTWIPKPREPAAKGSPGAR